MKNWLSVVILAATLMGYSAPSFADEAALNRKLDQVLTNQERILSELAVIQSELAVVKVRASSK